MKFRKKPVEIEAVQYTGDNWGEVDTFARGYVMSPFQNLGCEVYDSLHNAWIPFKISDWIIKGVKGEFYPCVDEVFQDTYEKVAE